MAAEFLGAFGTSVCSTTVVAAGPGPEQARASHADRRGSHRPGAIGRRPIPQASEWAPPPPLRATVVTTTGTGSPGRRTARKMAPAAPAAAGPDGKVPRPGRAPPLGPNSTGAAWQVPGSRLYHRPRVAQKRPRVRIHPAYCARAASSRVRIGRYACKLKLARGRTTTRHTGGT